MKNTISAIILAGGQGRRLGYQNKGLLEWSQKPLIAHVIERIEPQVSQLIINCNQDTDQYGSFGYPVISDSLDNFQGPLAGIQAALTAVESSYCLICPCDTPSLPDDLVSKQAITMQDRQANVAYPVCNGRKHFLPALIRCNLAESLNKYLADGQRSVKGWFKTLDSVEVDFSDQEQCFSNINTPESLGEP